MAFRVAAAAEDFPKTASFALELEEARYLQERILAKAGGTMLACLIGADSQLNLSGFPWEYEGVARLPASVRNELDHARRFSAVMHGAALVYNALIAHAQQNEESMADFRDRLLEWTDEMVALRPELESWDVKEFWRRVRLQNNRIGRPTWAFIQTWIDMTVKGSVMVGDDISGRRRAADLGPRAIAERGAVRLLNKTAMEQWNGEAGNW
ncbi:MAG: hypothetical protein IPL06_19240, partial [Betaproteobacteria bacterium]|nr:hypothetical protein [Betaproteobacteria bacterium]